jgi:hypothetical protein
VACCTWEREVEGGDSDGNSVSEAGADSASCKLQGTKREVLLCFWGWQVRIIGVAGNLGLDIVKQRWN